MYSYVKCIPCGSWTSRCFHLEILSCIFVQPLSQEFLNFSLPSTWTSVNKIFRLCLFILFFSYEMHTMQYMNFWQLWNRTSLYFALVTEKVWVFYIHRTSLTFLFEFLRVLFRNMKIGVLIVKSNFFIIFNSTYWFYSLVIENLNFLNKYQTAMLFPIELLSFIC